MHAAGIAEISGMVADIVLHYRGLGVSGALPIAAAVLGVGLRRAWSYLHGESRALPPGELARCHACHTDYLAPRRAVLLREADVIGVRLTARRSS